MKFSTILVSLLVNAATVSVLAATTTVKQFADLGLDNIDESSAAPAIPAGKPLTNGQRFASGMPPLKPRRMHDAFVKRQAATSPTYKTGTLSVYGRGSGTLLGYVAASLGVNHFWTLTQDVTQALPVSYVSSSGIYDINQLNSNIPYPEFGAAVSTASSSNDFSAGSSNFAVLVPTSHTNFGSPAASGPNNLYSSAPIESCIWSYDRTTGQFTPHWVNSDGSSPPTYTVLQSTNGALLITGDVTATANDFGANTQVDIFST